MADDETFLSPAARRQMWLELFEKEFPRTLRVMRAYPAANHEFKPHERSQTALRLVHTFSLENAIVLRTMGGARAEGGQMPAVPETYDAAVNAYEAGAREALDAVRTATGERLSAMVPFGPPALKLEFPAIELLWLMLLDSIHHRGQLSVYVRMAGGKVPSIYGPSGDDSMTGPAGGPAVSGA